MTLDDLERPFRTLFQNTCVFGAHHENFNEVRPILSSAKMWRNDYIVSCNISSKNVDLAKNGKDKLDG